MHRLRIHDGSRSPDQYRALRHAITEALEQDVAEVRAGRAHDLDRDRLRACFDERGFAGQHFGLDFDAPLAPFIGQLLHIHRELLPAWEKLTGTYPDGTVAEDELSRLELPEGFGAED